MSGSSWGFELQASSSSVLDTLQLSFSTANLNSFSANFYTGDSSISYGQQSSSSLHTATSSSPSNGVYLLTLLKLKSQSQAILLQQVIPMEIIAKIVEIIVVFPHIHASVFSGLLGNDDESSSANVVSAGNTMSPITLFIQIGFAIVACFAFQRGKMAELVTLIVLLSVLCCASAVSK